MEDFVWDGSSILNHIKSKGDLEKKDRNHKTPLAYACDNGDLDLVKTLIKVGSHLETIDFVGWKPLIRACAHRRLDIAKVLIKAGANIEAATGTGWTPLLFGLKFGSLNFVRFLIAEGADINIVFSLNNAHLLNNNPYFKKMIEENVHQLTSESMKKWKAYQLKALFM